MEKKSLWFTNQKAWQRCWKNIHTFQFTLMWRWKRWMDWIQKNKKFYKKQNWYSGVQFTLPKILTSIFQLGKVEKMARNKEFDDALDELKMLHDAKNHDYATEENPYKNLEGVSRIGIEPWRGIVIRLMDKFERVEQYCTNGELAIKSEGMEDTFKDIAVYSTLAMILFRKSENLKELQGKEWEPPELPDPPKWDLPPERPSLFPADDTTQELTEAERGKDAGNDEDKYWAKEIKKSEKFAREAVMKRRVNGPIS